MINCNKPVMQRQMHIDTQQPTTVVHMFIYQNAIISNCVLNVNCFANLPVCQLIDSADHCLFSHYLAYFCSQSHMRSNSNMITADQMPSGIDFGNISDFRPNTEHFIIYEQRKLNWWQKRTSLEKSLLFVFLFSVFLISFFSVFLASLYSKYGFALKFAQPLNLLLRELTKIDKNVILDTIRKAQLCYTPGCIWTASNILRSINTQVSPCDNFYEYSCGNWIKRMNIPEDAPETTNFDELTYQLTQNIHLILDNDLPLLQNHTAYGLLYQFWTKCNNKTQIEMDGDQQFRSFLWSNFENPFDTNQTTKLSQTPPDLVSLYEQVWNQGYPMNQLFKIQMSLNFYNITQNTLVISPPSFSIPYPYLVNSNNSSKIRQQHLLQFMSKTFQYLGQTAAKADLDAHEMLEFERQLAFLSQSHKIKRKPIGSVYDHIQKSTIGELTNKSPGMPWKKLINILLPKSVQLTDQSRILLFNPDYVYGLTDILQNTSPLTIRKYLIWRLTKSMMWTMDSRWTHLAQWYRQMVYGTTEQSDRWSFCLEMMNSQLNALLGSLYLRRYQDDHKQEQVRQLISAVHRQMLNTIDNQNWLDGISRHRAFQLVSKMRFVIGYPDQLRNVTLLQHHFSQNQVTQTGTFYSLMLETTLMHRRLIPSTLNQDRKQHEWTRYTNILSVNAYYTRYENLIFIPLGILGDQFFMQDRPAFNNLASVGFVAGHEMMHALDYPCDGSRFNSHGGWCSELVMRQLESKSACFRESYAKLRTQEGLPVAGDRTLAENLADIAGMKLAYQALQSISSVEQQRLLPGLQNYTVNQLFFITYAMNWCRKARPSTLRMTVELDNHSMYKYRVIGVLRNSKEFAQAFQCKPGAYMNPAKECKLW